MHVSCSLFLVLYFYKNYLRMRLCFLSLLILSFMLSYSQHTTTLFEQSGGTQTPTYYQIINWWHKRDAISPTISIKAMDTTDAGFPLHLILVSGDKDFNIGSLRAKSKSIIF